MNETFNISSTHYIYLKTFLEERVAYICYWQEVEKSLNDPKVLKLEIPSDLTVPLG